MKKIIFTVSLLLSACSSIPMTPEARNEAINHHETLAEEASERGRAIATAPAEPRSSVEMNRAYDEAKRHTLRASALQQSDSFFGPVLVFFLDVFK